jgi:hypothetical protein
MEAALKISLPETRCSLSEGVSFKKSVNLFLDFLFGVAMYPYEYITANPANFLHLYTDPSLCYLLASSSSMLDSIPTQRPSFPSIT